MVRADNGNPVRLASGQYLAVTAVEIALYELQDGMVTRRSSQLYEPGARIIVTDDVSRWFCLEPGDEFLTPVATELHRLQ